VTGGGPRPRVPGWAAGACCAVKATTFDPPVVGSFLNLSTRVAVLPPGVVQRALCAP